MNNVFAFEVWVHNKPQWASIVNARTIGQAKSQYHNSITESWSDIPFILVRAKKIGPPQTSIQFKNNAIYRGLPNVKCGDRVKVGDACGTIVGHNNSANFDVLFDGDSPKYANLKLNVHPSECKFE